VTALAEPSFAGRIREVVACCGEAFPVDLEDEFDEFDLKSLAGRALRAESAGFAVDQVHCYPFGVANGAAGPERGLQWRGSLDLDTRRTWSRS
jgi:hypothetical protein